MTSRSPFICLAALICAACGGTPQAATAPLPPAAAPVDAAPVVHEELERAPETPLLAIDWAATNLVSDADTAALWAAIAPTGADWEAKLHEVPLAHGRVLGAWLLAQGNVRCAPPPSPAECAPLVLDVEPPKPAADMSDPCLRRMLALWSLGQLDDADVPHVMPALRALAVLPPPESELVAGAIEVIPEGMDDARLELIALAYAAGQRDVANGQLGELDEAHVIAAATKHHIDGALEILSAQAHRAVFLAAITDDKMQPRGRIYAMDELLSVDDKLEADARAALVTATKAKDCAVAATAARALAQRGDKRFVPARPRTSSPAAWLRAVCVIASYERLQANDEPSLLAALVPPKGLEEVLVSYDPLGEVDTDGDGDPHTERTVDLVTRDRIVVPEVDDMVRAFRRCTGTDCVSHDRDFRFVFKPVGGQMYLTRLEIAERPPCPST